MINFVCIAGVILWVCWSLGCFPNIGSLKPKDGGLVATLKLQINLPIIFQNTPYVLMRPIGPTQLLTTLFADNSYMYIGWIKSWKPFNEIRPETTQFLIMIILDTQLWFSIYTRRRENNSNILAYKIVYTCLAVPSGQWFWFRKWLGW